jgi:hypothetical protein
MRPASHLLIVQTIVKNIEPLLIVGGDEEAVAAAGSFESSSSRGDVNRKRADSESCRSFS